MKSAAAAEKGVEHNLATGRAVEDRVGDHRNGLDGLMQRQQIALFAAVGKRVGPGVMPNVAAVAPEPAELDVVAVRAAPLFEDEDKLVLAAVERAHPAVVFDPDAKVLQFGISVPASGHQFFDMAPVHADIMQ